jgi:hypothetical protein
MSVVEFLDSLLGRERTRPLGLQLAGVYDERRGRPGAVGRGQ